ncbi:MAG: TolC family protein, partial [Candidatus Acidiferrum sp.]
MAVNTKPILPAMLLAVGILSGIPASARAGQQPETPAPQTSSPNETKPEAAPAASAQAPAAAPGTLRMTLQDALDRARKNSTVFQAAQTDAAIARQDHYQAGASLLPSVVYNNLATYTKLSAQGQNNAIFIANNGAHEYISQANVHEAIDLAGVANFRKASAAAAAARAKAEIASRGLVVTVVQLYYALAAAQHKLETAQK